MEIPLEDFIIGLEVELQHGTSFKDSNVTNNHPLLTARLSSPTSETIDYYRRLEVAELEGVLCRPSPRAILRGLTKKYAALLQAGRNWRRSR